ncbi:DNA polymerase III subunit alpha [Actinocatenispora comari]|uniref:DNA polymerase III subunit alpha n=1 Tax=Actinocatenispora comari TaxID=2807577 RepID=A0A8J4AK35_9ACTN|nr:DNA polymerase III subunit alpha [Actinocatenispora comari]GIL32025.1 DNA-directed DNA polymerase [Actinocatenispora comari]
MTDSFTHLHVHTEYSMLDGAARLKPLLAEVQRHGMDAIAMTDHGNMFGGYAFYQEATKAGVKPILGIEAYLAPGDRSYKQPVRWGRPDQRGDDVSGGGAYTHMTMWAENATGLRNLFTLSSRASIEGYYYKPRMDTELLSGRTEGILATTGCPSGEVQTRLRLGQPDEALAAAARYQDIFGKDNFFLELMDHGLDIEKRVREGLLDIGKRLSLRPVVTNDSHYVAPEDATAHEALLCVQSNSTLDDPNRFRLEGGGYYIKSPAEMRQLWDSQLPGACDTTLWIAERVGSYAEVFDHHDRMPVFEVPESHDASSWLKHEVYEGLKWRYPNGVPADRQERADFELSVIDNMGFPGYFLVVADLINHARKVGIGVGPGRGSAVGSLVAYALGITALDPIPLGLLFERFLNPERISMPDIDLDFDDRRRGEMIEYSVNKYGADKIAQVITFGTIKTKAALKDSARIHLGQPGFSIADKISKALPPPVAAKDIPLAGIVDPKHERYAEAVEVRTLIETDPQVAKIFETARGLEGLIRQPGVHACAVIMSSEPVIDSVPIWARPQDGSIITGFDYPSCESMGLLKMDFLGLRNLTVIGDAIANIHTNRGVDIDLDTLSLDDANAYALMARGDTLGVFQLDGGGMRALLQRMGPTGFADATAAIALYRPGPMAVNAHLNYADRKNGKQDKTPIHPELEADLEEILAETHGLIVYQEQIMLIARKLAGFTMGGADILRKAMGKKKKEVLEEQFTAFHKGMLGNGFSDESIQTLWDTILPFAGYAFNKSHAAGYAMVSYWTAYLKANYPAEYMAALLTSVGDSKDKMAIYLAECRKMGIRVLLPDVNDSDNYFTAVGDDIRFGLGAIRNVGANVVASIIKTRTEKGAYSSFTDFMSKIELPVCNKRVIESLAKAGAFDSLGHSRRPIIQEHETVVEAMTGVKRSEANGQFDLFGAMPDAASDKVVGMDIDLTGDEWPRKTVLEFEREMLGLYVSGHPLDGAERVLRKNSENRIADIVGSEDTPDGQQVTIAGIITSLERRVTKQGNAWAKATVEDLDAAVEVLFFPKTYELVGQYLAPDLTIAVKGRVNRRDQEISVVAMDMRTLEITDADLAAETAVTVAIPAEKVDTDLVGELKRTLLNNRGETAVRIKLVGRERNHLLALDDALRVTPGPGLVSELKSLLGAGCLE